MNMSVRPHGYARYRLDNCRCYVCGWARSQYEENRQKQIVAGTWQPFVDAAPVREHVLSLQAAGLGTRRIAELAGLDRKRVVSLLNGRVERGTPPVTKVRAETAEALMRVRATLRTASGKALIDPTGTRRRSEGMFYLGYSRSWQAAQIGWAPNNFGMMLGRQSVVASTALLVAEMATRVGDEPAPPGVGATRSLRESRKLGFLPPIAWDDETIDDPDAVPSLLPPVEGSDPVLDEMTVQRFAAGWTAPMPEEVRGELVWRLMSGEGRQAPEVAELVGTDPETVRRLRRNRLSRYRDAVARVSAAA